MKTPRIAVIALLPALGCSASSSSERTASTSSSIIGGTVTQARPEIGFYGGKCGATAISPVDILTAAHCIDLADFQSEVFDPGGLFVIEDTHRYGVVRAHSFAQGPHDNDHDVMLLRLGQPIPADLATPATVADVAPTSGQTVTRVGFGCGDINSIQAIGVKRYETFSYGVWPTGTLCGGDSGGPGYFGAVDGSGAVWGILSGGYLDPPGEHFAYLPPLKADIDAVRATWDAQSAADTTPPSIAIVSPAASGAPLSGSIDLRAVVTDDFGVSAVAFILDGRVVGQSLIADASVRVDTQELRNGSHTVLVEATDTNGNSASASRSFVTSNASVAEFDASLGAPRCAGFPRAVCSSVDLLAGRGPLGPEPNAPNTLSSACGDGASGSYRHDGGSVEQVRVYTADGRPLAAGRDAYVDTTVYADDRDPFAQFALFSAADPQNPQWAGVDVQTLDPPPYGLRTVTSAVTLPSGPVQALRAVVERSSSPAACTSGDYDDHDDLVFPVGEVASFDASLGVPHCYQASASCDSGDLVAGRGAVGPEPNAPNTLDACADGDDGTYLQSPSIEWVHVYTKNGSSFAAGNPVTIEASVSASYPDDPETRQVTFYAAQSTSTPQWVLVGSRSFRSLDFGQLVLGVDYTPQASGPLALRVHFGDSAGPCSAGPVEDQDDLVIEIP